MDEELNDATDNATDNSLIGPSGDTGLPASVNRGCTVCGEKFSSKRGDAKFCSSTCRNRASRKEASTEKIRKFDTSLDKSHKALEDAGFKMGIRFPFTVIPTGSILLDLATDVGGFPRGRITEIYGPSSAGKTSLVLTIIAEAQRRGVPCAYIDAEHSLKGEYLEQLGIKKLSVFTPTYGEESLDFVEKCLLNGFKFIVVDSVAAMTPRAEVEGDMEDSHIGRLARMMGQGLRKLLSLLDDQQAVLIFINQIRTSIGVWGNPEVTPGGWALKFYASLRIDVRRVEQIRVDKKVIGSILKIKVTKNKVGFPMREALVDLYFGKGIDRDNEVHKWAKELDLIPTLRGDPGKLLEQIGEIDNKLSKLVVNNYKEYYKDDAANH